jgi:uncharacterized protein
MRTYDRNGVHIEQCEQCRGIFLDYGELEALSRAENEWIQPAPPPAPGYQQHQSHHQPHHQQHYGRHKQRGMFQMLFSS